MRAADAFLELVNRPTEADLALDVGALLIAAAARPGTPPEDVVGAGRAALDALAAGCGGTTVGDLRTHLFEALGFAGNRDRYDDPRNSYLDVVLERRMGIPITLAVVVLEVGRRLGLDVYGAGMPGHFLVGVGDGLFLDAFDGGQLLDEVGCRRRFHDLVGERARWSPALLAPVGPRAILARMLANLRALFVATQDLGSLDWVLGMRLGIPGVPPDDRELRSSVLSALGRFDDAATELEHLARAATDSAELSNRAARLRARLN